MSYEHQKMLVRGLVGDKHHHSYLNDAEFKASVDALARLLPLWMDGIAEQCKRSADLRAEQYEQLVRTPSSLRSFLPPD